MSHYLARPRIQTAVKGLLLFGLALFLYSRLMNGTILFYINQNFVPYTMLAIVGLMIVAISYRPWAGKLANTPAHTEPHNHEDEHVHSTDTTAHDHSHDHSHALTASGLWLLLLPMLLGVLVPPQPLGASAMANREVSMSLQTSSLPAAVRAAANKGASERNVLDWLQAFAGAQDPARDFAGQPAKVVGFVFRDRRFGAEQFMVARYVISCCVADANVAGMVVRWPKAAALPADQWVEVQGVLQPGKLGSEELPVLAAQTVANVEVPSQPYLYP